VVEVNHQGQWWVRQVGMGSRSDEIQDLDVKVAGGKIVRGCQAEAITWGDLHATMVEPWVVEQSMEMLDTLKPRYQFLHDVLEGASINRHVNAKGPDPHYGFYRWLRGLHRFDAEIAATVEVVKRYLRPWCKTVVPESNHDGGWLRVWLAKPQYVLAMKILAARRYKDVEDIIPLARHLSLTTVEDLRNSVKYYYPEEEISSERLVFLRDLVGKINAPPQP